MPYSVFIKSMVCNRCKLVVNQLFKDFNISPVDVQLGEVVLERELTKEEIDAIKPRLEQFGFELIDNNGAKIATKIKSLLIELIESGTFDLKLKLSGYLSEKLNYEYHYLSGLFSEVEGKTIEKYFIAQKIERVKELLVYDELSLSEIAFRLNYSSVAYLSNQFKKVTGLTPSHFRQIKEGRRKPLDKV